MKRTILAVVCVLSVLLNICLVGILIKIAPYQKPVKIVYLEEPDSIIYPSFYDWTIQQYPSDLKVAPIVDYTDAAEKGQQLWETVLQRKNIFDREESVNPGSYVLVFYIPEEESWVIYGTSPDYGEPDRSWTGVLPIAIITQDGTVLSVARI